MTMTPYETSLLRANAARENWRNQDMKSRGHKKALEQYIIALQDLHFEARMQQKDIPIH
jgi:hypothetical protein